MAYSGAFRLNTPEPEEAPAVENEPAETRENRSVGQRKRLPFDLGALFEKTEAAGMEADDLLMALILYLMYRESGDIDLLIMLGVMLLT